MMKKKFVYLFAAAALLTACGSDDAKSATENAKDNATEQMKDAAQKVTKKSGEEVDKMVDDAIKIVDQAGSFDFHVKGDKLKKDYMAKGDQATYEAKISGNVIRGKVEHPKVDINFSFPNKLGYQSLDVGSVTVEASIKDGVNVKEVMKNGKVSITRAKQGDFLVGSISGTIDVNGKPHTAHGKFQIPLQ